MLRRTATSTTSAARRRTRLRLRQPDRQVRDRRADGRHRADRPQDHRRHVRRRRAARRRRVLRQGPDEGRPLGRLRGALRREERRRGRARRPLRGAGRVRDRRRAPVSRARRQLRHRGDPEARLEELVRRTSTSGPAAIIRDLDLRRPIYAKTAAYGHFGRDDRDFTWERTDRAAALRAAAGLDGAGRSEPGREPAGVATPTS